MAVRDLLFLLVMLAPPVWHLDQGTDHYTVTCEDNAASLVDRKKLAITPIHSVRGDKSLVEGRCHTDKALLLTEVWHRLLNGDLTNMQRPAWLRLSPAMPPTFLLPATVACLALLHRITLSA